MAGFRDRRGQGGERGGYPPRFGQAGAPAGYGAGAAPSGEPEYYGSPAGPPPAAGSTPGYDDTPGHTRAFTMGGPEGAYGNGSGPSYPNGGSYRDREPSSYDNVATYRAGQAAAPPAGPRLHWKALLGGIVRHPGRTFWQMRDHTMWGPALTVTFVYGLLAVFGFDGARQDVLDATLSTSIPWVLTTAVAVVLCGLTLGAVTNTLARQLGGDGAWAPTIGLAMLITSLTDAPRLLFALFLGGANSFVQLLGWLTWVACAVLLTSMVRKSHDLPWLKALGAASIQLVALLTLFKLPLI
ncbi:Yip1 family protein [Streptomyces sp.]|uniref:Yip1 family protein n=1 Tax=Streptomyces sp. TaxID=1931 RepID=UPI002F4044A1